MNTAKRIAESLKTAARDTAARKSAISAILSRHPDGYAVHGWTKFTVAGDVFWTKGTKNLTGGQLLETLGIKLIKAGAISEADYYGA